MNIKQRIKRIEDRFGPDNRDRQADKIYTWFVDSMRILQLDKTSTPEDEKKLWDEYVRRIDAVHYE